VTAVSLGRRVVLPLGLFLLRVVGIFVLTLGAIGLATRLLLEHFARESTEAWVESLRGFTSKLGITFLPVGLAVLFLLYFRSRFLRELRDGHESESETISGWTSFLAFSLAVLPLVALALAGPLLSLWRDAFALMDTLGVWKMLNGGDFGAVLVLAVAGIALLVPLFELLTLVSFLVASVVLLLLLYSKRRDFPAVFVACVLIQFALVAGSFYAIDLMANLTPAAEKELAEQASTGHDQESVVMVAWVRRHDEVIGPTALSFAGLFLGYLFWAPVVVLSKGARAAFATGAATAGFVPRAPLVESPACEAPAAKIPTVGVSPRDAAPYVLSVSQTKLFESKVAIRGRPNAQQLEEAREAASELQDVGRQVRFKPDDPADVQRAIELVERTVDERLSRFQDNPWAAQVGKAVKDSFRQRILQTVADVQREEDSSEPNSRDPKTGP
jgi:hypothetical protein